MAVAARKQEPESALKMFHATVLVTRAEEWCVEAETAEEARQLLATGQGHRCHLGDCLHAEVQQLEEWKQKLSNSSATLVHAKREEFAIKGV